MVVWLQDVEFVSMNFVNKILINVNKYCLSNQMR